MYSNTARAFNYVLKLALINFINCKLIANDALLIQLDERNERPDSVRFLEDYLNTELQLTGLISGDVKIKYFDSCNNQIVQIADVFSNLFYSHIMNSQYSSTIQKLKNDGYIKKIFKFPSSSFCE